MSETLLDLFAEQVSRTPRRVALRYRSGGIWLGRTWSEWASTSRRLAAALCGWGLSPGERVAILSHTRIRWVEADLSVLHAGAATVPIYPTLRADTVGEILRDSAAKIVFAEDPVQLAKLFEESTGALPALERVVVFDRVSRLQRPDAIGRLDVTVADVMGDLVERQQLQPEREGDPERGREVAGARRVPVHTFEEALELGRVRLEERPAELDERAAEVSASSLAALYYTSGTSGEPKGVPLSHDSFVFETEALCERMPVGPSDEQLLFLPLAHIMAKLTVMMQLRVGFVTSFASSIDEAVEDCRQVRPTFLIGVPRFYEKLQEGIEAMPVERGDVQQRVFDWALGVGRKIGELSRRGARPATLLSLQHRTAQRLVLERVQEQLGGRIRFMLTGAAPLSRQTAEFFQAFGLLLLEGYGLTESTGASTLNLPHRYRFGTVGAPLPGVEVKVAEDGEILIRGRSVMAGYWKRGADREQTFTPDGFLRTGDVGTIDADGFLTITDRKKDLIITAGGKNVAPQRVEQRLTRSPYIDRAVVLGDRRKFPVALLVLNAEAIHRWADDNGLGGDISALARHPKVRTLISSEVERVNQELARFEAVKRFEILQGDLSVASGALTPTGKLKRRVIAQRFADLIDQLYEGVTTELEEIA